MSEQERSRWSKIGTSLQLVGFGDFVSLFLYMAHLRIDLNEIPSEILFFIWLFGFVLLLLGSVLDWDSGPLEETLPQGLAQA